MDYLLVFVNDACRCKRDVFFSDLLSLHADLLRDNLHRMHTGPFMVPQKPWNRRIL